MTEGQIRAATRAVRAYINEVAGFYAGWISDDHCRELAIRALKASEAKEKK
jgi:hypothetical protein